MDEIDAQEQRRGSIQSKERDRPTTSGQDANIEATILEIHDDSLSSTSSGSELSDISRASIRSDHCSEPRGIMTIPMHPERVPTGLDQGMRRGNDTIAWSAHVYDAKRVRKLRHRDRSPLDVDVRYVDHKPLMLTKQHRGRRRLRQRPDDDDVDSFTGQRSQKWRGPVLEVLVHVRASIFDRYALPPGFEDGHLDAPALGSTKESSTSPSPLPRRRRARSLPRSRSRSTEADKVKWTSTKTDILPMRIEDLFIDQWSRKTLIVRSPHLRAAICICTDTSWANIPQSDIQFYPSSWASLLVFEEPYRFLLQNFQEFMRVERCEKKPSTTPDESNNSDDETFTRLQKEHLSILVKFLQPTYQRLIEPCLRHLSQTPPQIAFNLLWYILKPMTNVYIRDDYGAIQVCVVGHCHTPDSGTHPIRRARSDGIWLTWDIELYYLVTDGARIGWRRTRRDIQFFSGLKDVVALDIVPVEVWDASDSGQRRQEIMKRGRLMEKILRQGFQQASHHPPKDSTNYKFSGKVVVDHRRGRNSTGASRFLFDRDRFLNARFPKYRDIYVNKYQKTEDPYDYAEYAPRNNRPRYDDGDNYIDVPYTDRAREDIVIADDNRRARPRPVSNIIDIDNPMPFGGPSHDQTISPALSEHQLLLLQPRLLAFGLKIKSWISVDIGHLEEIESSTESIENLVIDSKELEVIRALSYQKNDDSWAADFIEGKGSGKIILLHGPPGVGKTYTVESIAQWLDCPLLALTVADIGTVETRIEGELLKWFSLAEAWNAVILVDEADIFLERRQNRDLARNGLVSAFLRRMEYFSGLLFLTTNRVGQIDDAFISRVHVAIEYKQLSPQYTRKIWEGFFRKLAKDRAGKIQVASSAKKWVLEKFEKEPSALNGRDIRNALQTAITLAQFEASEDPDFDANSMVVVVGKDHFERVLEMSNNFQDYVTSIRKEDEKQRASAKGDRNDFRDGATQAMSAALAQQYLMPGARSTGRGAP